MKDYERKRSIGSKESLINSRHASNVSRLKHLTHLKPSKRPKQERRRKLKRN